MSLLQVWLAGLGVVAAMMAATWLASLLQRDASLVDRVWGLAFVVLAWTYLVVGADPTPRGWLVTALVSVWGLRLSIHITLRNRHHGEAPSRAGTCVRLGTGGVRRLRPSGDPARRHRRHRR